MIFKITKEYDEWENLIRTSFKIVEKEVFKEQKTEYFGGSTSKVEYHKAVDMHEVYRIIRPRMFENYTDYAKFLITTEATLKNKGEK